MKKDFVPDSFLNLRDWASNLFDQIAIQGPVLGWTAGQVTAFQTVERRLTWRLPRSAVVLRLSFILMLFAHDWARATETVSLSLTETVRQSEAIVVGTVVASESHWGDQSRRWMITKYRFEVEKVLASDTGAAKIGDSITLTYWGGTIGDETQEVAGMRKPRIGENLVLMLAPNWNAGSHFSPLVGLSQGYFRVARNAPIFDGVIEDDEGVPLIATPNGQIARAKREKISSSATATMSGFEKWIRTSFQTINSQPSEIRPAPKSKRPNALKPFQKIPGLNGTPRASRSTAPRVNPDDITCGTPIRPYRPVFISPTLGSACERSKAIERPAPLYSTSHQAHLPIVVNNFPSTFSWSPEDQYQMSKWNYYAPGVFQVYTEPTGTYNWPDGVFDLDGFPSSDELLRVYGSVWESNVIALTFSRYDGSGFIVEADIALNPAFAFTLDDEAVYDGGGAQGFRQVMIHELGHMHGLEHNFDFLSVMNYVPSVFRAQGLPYMDDAAGIRAEYPGNAAALTDLAVYLFRESGYQNVSDASFNSNVAPGGTLTVNNYHVENVGTTTIAVPTLEWYLTSARSFASQTYYLGTTMYSALAPFTYFDDPGTVERSFTVPASVPPGSYFLAAYIRDDGGAEQSTFPYSNNSAFSRLPISVGGSSDTPFNDRFADAWAISLPFVSLLGTNISATKEVGEPAHAGNEGGASVWFVWTRSGTVNLNTVGSDFDTLLAVYTGESVDQLSEVTSNDDDPNGGSESAVTFEAEEGKSYYIALDGYGGATGQFVLNVTSNQGPVITSPLVANARVGEAFFYQITATNQPTSFGATPLPSGLVFDPVAGVISGEPTDSGETDITISASNGDTSGEAILRVIVESAAPRLRNISTRMDVLAGDNVLIGGFIIAGPAPKQVLLRAIGPSLVAFGLADALADPVLELHIPGGVVITNDNWKETQQAEIEATELEPSEDLESAIVATLDPGAYTAIVRGQYGGTGVGLIEAYDLDAAADSTLANISTRGFVDTGDNVMIGGMIIGGGSSQVLVRAIGPALTDFGVSGALEDPILELHDKDGSLITSNDDWKESQQSAIEATGLAPTKDQESAILATLTPDNYTAIVRGKGDTTGVALVEVYNVSP